MTALEIEGISIDAAENAMRRHYWQEVRSLARELIQELKDDCDTTGDDAREWLDERLWETIDSHQWVIYTWWNHFVLMWSDNSGAYADEFGAEGLVKDGAVNYPALAFTALLADVREQLEAEGVDLMDPKPEED